MEELASIWYNVISLNQKTGKRYMTMTKPTFTDEFKQGVVQYVLDHPNESKVAKSLVLLTAQSINGLKMPIIMMV